MLKRFHGLSKEGAGNYCNEIQWRMKFLHTERRVFWVFIKNRCVRFFVRFKQCEVALWKRLADVLIAKNWISWVDNSDVKIPTKLKQTNIFRATTDKLIPMAFSTKSESSNQIVKLFPFQSALWWQNSDVRCFGDVRSLINSEWLGIEDWHLLNTNRNSSASCRVLTSYPVCNANLSAWNGVLK